MVVAEPDVVEDGGERVGESAAGDHVLEAAEELEETEESREEEDIGSVGGLGLRWLVGWIRFICLRERARHPNYSRKTGK